MLETSASLENAIADKRKNRSANFYHTTRLAAWRQTRFKSATGVNPNQQSPVGEHLLQGLTYTAFLDQVATARAKGDAKAVSVLVCWLWQGHEGTSQLENIERKHWALRPHEPLKLIRDGEVGGQDFFFFFFYLREFLYLTPTRYAVATRRTMHEGGLLCEPC